MDSDAQLFEKERRRGLSQVHSLRIDLARRHDAEKRAKDGDNSTN